MYFFYLRGYVILLKMWRVNVTSATGAVCDKKSYFYVKKKK